MKLKLSLGTLNPARLCISKKSKHPAPTTPIEEKSNGSVDLYPPEDMQELMKISQEIENQVSIESQNIIPEKDNITINVNPIVSIEIPIETNLDTENNSQDLSTACEVGEVAEIHEVNLEFVQETIREQENVEIKTADNVNNAAIDSNIILSKAPILLEELLSSPACSMSPAKIKSISLLEAISPRNESKQLSPAEIRSPAQNVAEKSGLSQNLFSISRNLFNEPTIESIQKSSIPEAPPLPFDLFGPSVYTPSQEYSSENCEESLNNVLQNLEDVYQSNRRSFSEKHLALLKYFKESRRDTWNLEEFQENIRAELELLRESGIVTLMTYYFEELLRNGKTQRIVAA